MPTIKKLLKRIFNIFKDVLLFIGLFIALALKAIWQANRFIFQYLKSKIKYIFELSLDFLKEEVQRLRDEDPHWYSSLFSKKELEEFKEPNKHLDKENDKNSILRDRFRKARIRILVFLKKTKHADTFIGDVVITLLTRVLEDLVPPMSEKIEIDPVNFEKLTWRVDDQSWEDLPPDLSYRRKFLVRRVLEFLFFHDIHTISNNPEALAFVLVSGPYFRSFLRKILKVLSI